MSTKLHINSTLRTNSGHDIPRLGYGVYQTPNDVCQSLCLRAFEAGYRHIDSAAAYRNEAACGKAIAQSGLPRANIFFTSKIPPRNLSYEKAKDVIDTTLHITGLDYVDLMLLHAPYGGRQARKGAWKALLEAQDDGKVRSIGISNYGVHHLDEMVDYMKELEIERGSGRGGTIDVGQWELHPWLTRPDIVNWCRMRNIVLQAYSPLVRGQRMNEERLLNVSQKYNKTPAQVLLRWSLQSGFVPLPKTVTPSRIGENAAIYDFELTSDDMEYLTTKEYMPCTWDPTISRLQD